MTEDLPKVTHTCAFTLWGVNIKCYILSDGKRIIDGQDFERLLKVLDSENAPALDPDQLVAFNQFRYGHGGVA
jgi:hypothetical protein